MKRITAIVSVLVAVVCAWRGTSAAPADIDTLLRTAVEQKRIPLVVAMVAEDKKQLRDALKALTDFLK